tara:strand:- start:784 stop:1230 length:447 start_codon:yes stop_codon:yes gene_type:complete
MEKLSSFKKNLIPQPSREIELVGGIKNALERGESMSKIKQSFINAGYKPGEVNAAVKRLSPQQISAPITTPLSSTPSKSSAPPISSTLPHSTLLPSSPSSKSSAASVQVFKQQPKKLSKLWIIIMIIISSLILIGSAILGLYWNKIFQ